MKPTAVHNSWESISTGAVPMGVGDQGIDSEPRTTLLAYIAGALDNLNLVARDHGIELRATDHRTSLHGRRMASSELTRS